MATINTTDDNFGVAKWIVDPVAGSGTHTTIASALTSASSGDTIFIRPGTYTENLTLVAGVNLTSFPSEYQGTTTSQVNIVGKLTCTFTGTVVISGITLQTNSDFVITSTGSNTGTLRLTNCNLNINNNTAINSSNANFTCLMYYCIYVINTTGITLATFTGGNLALFFCRGQNPGLSTTASTFAASVMTVLYSEMQTPITISTTGGVSIKYSIVNNGGTNATCITAGGSGTQAADFCEFLSGTASTLSIGGTMTVTNCTVNSSNANVITGGGTLIYSNIVYTGSSNTVNTTTITRDVVDGATYKGQNTNTAIPAGMIGEEIRSTVAAGSAITCNNTTQTNITSINLTPGVWEISGIISITGTLTGTVFAASVNTTSATLGTQGDNRVDTPTMPTANSHVSMSIPAWRQLFSAASTTVYLVALVNYTVGTATGYGRISAVRVA
jgi:hypothetical protein